jgi:hypothetical protein
MWYARVAVEFGLHHGLITWDDVRWSLNATGRLPANTFADALSAMERAWGDDHLAKLAINSLIGLMARDDTCRFQCVTSKDSEDAPGHTAKRQVVFKGDYTIDWISKVELHTNATLRPIHDQIMHTEAVRVAQLLFIAKQASIPPACVKYLKTDCVSLQGVPTKRRKLLDEAMELTFADLPQLHRRASAVDASQGLLCPEMTPCSHTGKVFQLKDNGAPLRGTYKEPHRDWHEPPPLLPWVDLDKAAAHRHVMAGGSLLVVSPPGCGKTLDQAAGGVPARSGRQGAVRGQDPQRLPEPGLRGGDHRPLRP